MGRSRRFLDGLKKRIRFPSPSPGVGSSGGSVIPVPSGDHGSLSSTSQAQVPSPHSSAVWAEALRIAKTKLGDNNFPFDITNLTSQSAKENIEAIIKALDTLRKDNKEKRWSYTWRGKEVIIVERLGKILKCVEKYSKVVDTAIQSNPQVSALVWAGIWAIMQVCIALSSGVDHSPQLY